ncbi:hypothetical protein AAG570_003536 [Ranatra chinensis]
MVEETIQEKSKSGKNFDDFTLDELDLIEDEEDEKIVLEYRQKRIAELKELASKSKFGSVVEISAQDYVNEVNKAGNDIYVVLHLFKQGIPLCALINKHLADLARKYPTTKFLKSISTTCIPNYPDKNLPTLFVYFEGQMKSQMVGPPAFRYADISLDELEWMLGKTGAIETDIKEDPRPRPKDMLFSGLKGSKNVDYLRDEDADDW